METKVLFLDFKTKENAEKARKVMAITGLSMTLLSATYCFLTKQKVAKSVLLVLGANAVGTIGGMSVSYLMKK